MEDGRVVKVILRISQLPALINLVISGVINK